MWATIIRHLIIVSKFRCTHIDHLPPISFSFPLFILPLRFLFLLLLHMYSTYYKRQRTKYVNIDL